MKKILSLLSLVILFYSGTAQNSELSISKAPFQRLVDPVKLESGWQGSPTIAIPFDFAIPTIGKFDSILVTRHSLRVYRGVPDESYTLAAMPFALNLDDTNEIRSSELFMKEEGQPGTRVLTIEFEIEMANMEGTYVYQASLYENTGKISFHYGECPFANELKNIVVVGLELMNADELINFHYLEGDPESPVSYKSLQEPYQYLTHCVSDSMVYTFNFLPNSLTQNIKVQSALQSTETGFRISNSEDLVSAVLYSVEGKIIAEGQKFGTYFFFQNLKNLPQGIYVVYVTSTTGESWSYKWVNQ